MNKNSLTKNSIYNMLYSGFNVIFPLVSITYLSRILMAEGIGKVEYARSVVGYFFMIAALGIPNYGVKIIAQAGDSISKRSKSFFEMFYLNAISTVIFIIIYYIFITYSDYFSERRILFYIMGSILVLNLINIEWFFQGIEHYVYIIKRSIAIKIISFFLIIFFVKNTNDYLIYAVIVCFAAAGNYVFNILYATKYIKFISIYSCNITRHLKPIIALLGSTIAIEVYSMLDTIILEYFQGELYVGYYINCVKIAKLVYTLSTALVATLYPRISSYLKENKIEDTNILLSKGTEILIIFAFPAAIGLFLVSDSLILVLFGASFIPSISCLKILSSLVIIFSVAYLLGHVILMASGNENRILFATLCGVGFNIVLNLLLIPSYKHYGAAIASVIAEILVTIILLTKSRKIIKITINGAFILSILISLVVMVISIKITNFLIDNMIVKLVSSIFVGAMTYFITLFLSKNQVILFFYSKVIEYNS